MLSQEYIEKMKQLAATKIAADDDEDFMVEDYAGGNIDDAYELGSNHRKVIAAREFVNELERFSATFC